MKREYYIYFKFPMSDEVDAPMAYGEILIGSSEKEIPYEELADKFPVSFLSGVLKIPTESIVVITPEEYERRNT